MTDDEKRVAIAEFDGYRQFPVRYNNDQKAWALTQEQADTIRLGMWLWDLTPDYLNDLNAIRNVMDNVNVADFVRNLRVIVGCCGEPDEDIEDDWLLINATASQCCDAVLKTIGKWKG